MKIKCTCDSCGCEFERESREVKRSKKLERKCYCSLKCSGKKNNKHLHKYGKLNKDYLNASNRLDEYSPFRPFLSRTKKRTQHENNLTLEYLKELWDENHVCCISGIELKPYKWNQKLTPYTPSLDRIDNTKGYVKGNVRYTTVMANYMRNTFTDTETKKFIMECKSN